MANLWDVRPKRERGEDTPEAIYLQVGQALTAWEALESEMAELFDALVTDPPSNRAAFAAFIAVKSSSARTELIEAAVPRALAHWDPLKLAVSELVNAFGKAGARRNEIAHGRVYNLDEHGFFLGPNNVMAHKWTDDGAAKYQYCADDVAYYADLFAALKRQCTDLVNALWERASDITRATSSRHEARDRRT